MFGCIWPMASLPSPCPNLALRGLEGEVCAFDSAHFATSEIVAHHDMERSMYAG